MTSKAVPFVTKEKLSLLQNLNKCSLMPQRWKQFEMTVGDYRELPSFLPPPKPIFMEKLAASSKNARRSESVLPGNERVATEPAPVQRDSVRKKTSTSAFRNVELKKLRDFIKKRQKSQLF